MADAITRADLDEVGGAFEELKRTVEAKSLDQDKLKNINVVLDEYEEKSQKIVNLEEKISGHEAEVAELKAALEEKATNAGEIREQVDKLQIQFAKQQSGLGVNDPNYLDTPEFKGFSKYVLEGFDAIESVEEKATLRTDSATEGGVLVVPEMESQMIKYINEIDPMRSIARVRPTANKSLVIPVRTTIPVAEYEGEAETGPESNSEYGTETLTAFRLTHTIPITRDMLMDASFDMESEIIGDSGLAFALAEGNGFVVGSGFKAPLGFVSDPRVIAAEVASLSSTPGTISPDDLFNIQGQLKDGYNGRFTWNRRTHATIRMMKGSDNHYLWAPALDGGSAPQIAGAPYTILNSMPDLANDSYSVAFGDFSMGYMILDRTATEVIRDDYSKKKQAIVEFTLHRWNTGKVVLPEAIKLLKTDS